MIINGRIIQRIEELDWATKYYFDGGFVIKYTLRHKIRLWFGIHGSMPDGSYCFNVPKTGNAMMQRILYKLMYYIGNPLLNKVIGYKKQ